MNLELKKDQSVQCLRIHTQKAAWQMARIHHNLLCIGPINPVNSDFHFFVRTHTSTTERAFYPASTHKIIAMKIPAEDNVPHRFELFLLGDGEKKVTETPDTRKLIFLRPDHSNGVTLSLFLSIKYQYLF